MPTRLFNWIAAIILTVVLVAMAIPRSFLFSGSDWNLALRGHPWVHYLEYPIYLATIILAAFVFGILGFLLLRLATSLPIVNRAVSAFLGGISIFGLSPLQPVFANVILILLVPTIADTGLFGIESLRWILTSTLVMLFGLALGAELALRVSENAGGDIRSWGRSVATVIDEQAVPLAGRIAVIVMAGPLMMTAISGLGRSPSQLVPDAPRFSFPVEGIFVAAITVLFGLAIWAVTSRFRQSSSTITHQYPEPSGARHALAWGLCATVIVIPLVMLLFADDPLVQRVDASFNEPSAQHWFGTDQLGRDVRDRLVFAWRDTVYAGLSIGVVLFGIGVFWRLITPFNRSLLAAESIMLKIPPAIAFFGLWGVLTGISGDAVTIRPIAIAVGITLIPVALALFRQIDQRAIPAAGAVIVMLGMLLVLGWSVVLGMLGLISPPIPNFGETLVSARAERIAAPWITTWTSVTLLIAVVLPLIALTALTRVYALPRSLIRLRG